jgi:hypothetical protein
LEEPHLKGEDFRTHQVNRIDSVIAEDRVLIEYGNKPPELFALSEDPEQQRNLADENEEQIRRERLSRELDEFRRKTDCPR